LDFLSALFKKSTIALKQAVFAIWPEIILDSDNFTIEEEVEIVMNYLKERGIV
jgi:hypothetical protein